MSASNDPVRELDLYGPILTPLNRPRLAAAACWLLVAGNTIVFLCITFSFSNALAGTHLTDNRIVSFVLYFLQFGFQGLLILALVLIWIADIARGPVNPWPRRTMVVIGVAGGLIAVAAHVHALAFRPSLPATTLSMETYWERYLALLLAGSLCECISNTFALVYALQIANWLRSRRFATASAIVLGLDLLVKWTSAVRLALVLAADKGIFTIRSPGIWETTNKVAAFAPAITGASLIAYFTILALNLHRTARRQARQS